MKKPKVKARRYRCKGFIDLDRCKNYALIETRSKLGSGEFAVAVTVKLCMPCSMKYGEMFPKHSDTKRSSPI